MYWLFTCIFLLSFTIGFTIQATKNTSDILSLQGSSSSLGDAVVNVQHFTQFNYEGSQVYVYSAKLNDEYEHAPLRWSFYYVPVLQPLKSSNTTDWTWATKKEVRMKLSLGNEQVEDAARCAISRRFSSEIASNFSHFWIVAPLMIDSITAFIIKVSGDPVEGVAPFRLVHPNALAIIFRYDCSNENTAHDIVEKLIDGDYEIEVHFYFAGFKHVSSNIITMTSQHLKSVLSKTIADGGNSNAKYIHRSQANKFTSMYATNVRKLIYMEKPGADSSALTSGLDEQFQGLFQQGIDSSTEIRLSAKDYDQIWHSSDLKPDLLTKEWTKMFVLNDTATKNRNDTNVFFNVHSQSAHTSSSSSNTAVGGSFIGIGASASLDQSNTDTLNRNDDKTTHDIISLSDVQHRIGQEAIEVEWTGEKFEPKSFSVYRLTDLTDQLQVAMISKHMFAEKQNGAISRRVSSLNTPIGMAPTRTSIIFPGEIRLFAGISTIPFYWLLCNGALLSRTEYSSLFNVIGKSYGKGDEDENHFRLPDLRGRVALGSDESGTRVSGANTVGKVGGQAKHILTVAHLPKHSHQSGTLSVEYAGTHSHLYTDPGHNHGGRTGTGNSGPGPFAMNPRGGYGNEAGIHTHSIDLDYTHITIASAGNHKHSIYGETETSGSNDAFNIMNPYQTLNYIIYAGPTST